MNAIITNNILENVYNSTGVLDLSSCNFAIVSDHCFAPSKSADLDSAGEPVICGEFLEEIILPDTTTTLESYSFYQCKNLSSLSVPSTLTEVHSDAFMNCKNLHTLIIRDSIKNASGLKFFLNQLTSEIEVIFDDAKILFPEYTESYEEVGPAHIFHLSVEGEGFRARKQFDNLIFKLKEYDEIFATACHQEGFVTLMKMAINRLNYPIDLTEAAANNYRQYIADNQEKIMHRLALNGDTDALISLIKSGHISEAGLKGAIGGASSNPGLISKIIVAARN